MGDLESALFVIFVAATLVQLATWWALFARLAFRGTAPAGSPYDETRFPQMHAEKSADARRDASAKISEFFCVHLRETDLNRFAPLKPGKAQNTCKGKPATILICARNEAANLFQNLPAVLEQQYPEFEVLVVDDDSTDDTPRVLENFQKKYPHLRVLRCSPKTGPGKKPALAKGIAAARNEYLVFTDADCRPASPFWLQGMLAAFNRFPEIEIVLGYGPYFREAGLLNKWIRFETVQTAMQYFSFALAGQPYMGVGRNLAWKHTLFNRVGGFEAHASVPSGDDDLLVNAAATARNTVVCLHPETFVYSYPQQTWTSWLRQKRRHLGAGVRYHFRHQILLGTLALTQCLHYFLLPGLLLTDFGTISVAFYAVRMASALPINLKILRRFREEQLSIWFPLFDAFLALYYAAFIPRFLISSDDLISWK